MNGGGSAPSRQPATPAQWLGASFRGAPVSSDAENDDRGSSTTPSSHVPTGDLAEEARRRKEWASALNREHPLATAAVEGESAHLQREWPQRNSSSLPGRYQKQGSPAGPSGSIAPSRAASRDVGASGRPDNAVAGGVGGADPRKPPQRPPRPSYVPSLDMSRAQQSESADQSSRYAEPAHRQWEEEYQRAPSSTSPRIISGLGSSSSLYSPHGYSSRPSPTSSATNTPDFPPPGSSFNRKSASVGAPPVRKGNSSYYSQYSTFTPIPEEGPESQGSHGSLASSRVIPSSWGSALSDDIPSWHLRHSANDDSPDLPRGDPFGTIPEEDTKDAATQFSPNRWPEPHLEPHDGPDLSNEVSSLSVTTSSQDEASRETSPTTSPDEKAAGRGSVHRRVPTPDLRKALQMATAAGMDSSGPSRGLGTVSSNDTFDKGPGLHKSQSLLSSRSGRSPAAALPSTDPRAQQMHQGVHRGTSVDDRRTARSAYSDTDGLVRNENMPPRRPARPNLEAARDAEARGSLTSLPDLIRRATRLATTLDRGRPSSRVELDIGAYQVEKRDRRGAKSPGQRSGSIADMLAHFPSPGMRDGAVSQGSGYPHRRPFGSSPAGALSTEQEGSFVTARQARKCCGLPIWSFVVLVVLGLILLIAAIVLPIVLVVLPRQTQTGGSLSSLADCQSQLRCENGGTNVFEGGSCRCLCTGGYTGDRCTAAPNNACVTTDLSAGRSQLRGVNIGSAIPRLLRQGPSAFDIPLDVPTILSAFAAQDASCNSQNALVTFNGRSMPLPNTPSITRLKARRAKRQIDDDKPVGASTLTLTAALTLRGKAAVTTGLVTQTATPTPTRTGGAATATTAMAGMPAGVFGDDNSLDFARVGILYILQHTGWDTAVTAQQRLQAFLNLKQSGSTGVAVTNSIGLDLQRHVLIFSNGTVVGGGNGSVGA